MVLSEERISRPVLWMAGDEGCRRGCMVKSLAAVADLVVEVLNCSSFGCRPALYRHWSCYQASKWWLDFCVVVRLMKLIMEVVNDGDALWNHGMAAGGRRTVGSLGFSRSGF